MKIRLKLYATLADHLPTEGRRGNEVEVDAEAGATVAGVIARFDLPPRLVHLVLVNGSFVPPEARGSHALQEGDALAIWPPVAGG